MPNLTTGQIETIEAIVSIFETSKISGSRSYGTVTYVKEDRGQLSYGKHQASLTSGRLYFLLQKYINAGGAKADALNGFIEAIKTQNPVVNTDLTLRDILSEAGKDPIMKKVQDEFFAEFYLKPALNAVDELKTKAAIAPLASAIVYDSWIHGSFRSIKEKVSTTDIGSKDWYREYCVRRHNWLATHSNTLLNKTVYRPNTFLDLINADNWELRLPIKVRGVLITDTALGLLPEMVPLKPITQSHPLEQFINATTEHLPVLFFTKPHTENRYVGFLQKNLSYLDANLLFPNPVAKTPAAIAALRQDTVTGKNGSKVVYYDNIFGFNTEKAVTAFQRNNKLKADGVVGEKTWDCLLDATGLSLT